MTVPAPALTPAASVAGPGRQLLRLTVAGAMYAIDIEVVHEILNVPPTTPVPLMPDFVRGVMNLRGAVVPVIDLGARIGAEPCQLGRRSCVVVVEVHAAEGAQTIGLLADAVHEVFGIPPEGLEAVPPMGTRVPAEFLSGIARAADRIVPVLAVERILELDELARLVGQHAVH
jgi:purine-binding chemotaxis protein CheW